MIWYYKLLPHYTHRLRLCPHSNHPRILIPYYPESHPENLSLFRQQNSRQTAIVTVEKRTLLGRPRVAPVGWKLLRGCTHDAVCEGAHPSHIGVGTLPPPHNTTVLYSGRILQFRQRWLDIDLSLNCVGRICFRSVFEYSGILIWVFRVEPENCGKIDWFTFVPMFG